MTTRRTKTAALVVGCAVVAGGGYAAADAISSPAQPGPGATALSSAVNGANSSASIKDKKRGALARLRGLPGEYGQVTYETRKKGERVLAFERGTIASVSGETVTVKAANGHTENWALTSRSAVRDDGRKTTDSALAAGKKILVAGPVSGSRRHARVIVIRDKDADQATQRSTTTTTS